MKAQILKIAGVKSEKEFYSKFPTEEAFMKKHGKEFKKAQTGAAINASQVRQGVFKPLSYQTQFDEADKMITGSTEAERHAALAKQQAAASQGGGGGGFDIAGLMKLAGSAMGGEGGIDAASGAGAGVAAAARYGADIHRAQFGGNYDLGKSPDFSMNANQGFFPKQNSFSMQTPKFNAYDPQGDQAGGKMAQGIFSGAHSVGDSPFQGENTWSKIGGALGKYAGPVGDVISGIGELKKEKEARKAAEQARDVSKISLKAAESIDVDARRQQSENIAKQRQAQMPVNTGEEFFPIYGVGTNVLARNGAMLQGGGEIQNTYDPNDIYTDSGYEPLNDSNVKQYYHGGRIHQMQDGGAVAGGGTPWGMISQKATGIGQELMGGQNAGGKIGSTVGSTLGMIGGPIGSAIGGFVGGIAGNALDTNAKRMKKAQDATQRNMQQMANANMAKGIQAQNQSYMEDGGWVSHDWQPQVIASFGGLNEQEVYDYAHEGMDTLRAGGHLRDYTPPSDRAMEIYKDGGDVSNFNLGEVEVESGGYLQPISYNPYNDGTGITSMIKGQSHDEYNSKLGHSGVILNAYGNQVEAERGEPIREMEEGGSLGNDKSAVITGNLVYKNINNIMDPKYKKYEGKKIKNIHKKIALKDQKLNKLEEKNTNKLVEIDPKTSIDKLEFATLQANDLGYKMQYKNNAKDADYFTNHQTIINDTAEEHGLVADDLARGKVKIDKEAQEQSAKFGGKFTQAKDGDLISKFNNTKKETEIALKKLYPGKKVELKIASEDRDIKTQRGLKGSGASKTDVSLHNIGGAKDFVIYVDGKRVDDADVYKKTLHPAAQKYGLHTLQDWDPYHVSAVQEGKGHPYAQAVKDYPELLKGKTTANTIAYLTEKVNSKQASPSELRAYSQLTGKSTKNIPPYNVDYSAEAKQANSPKIEWEDAVVPIDNTTPATTSADSTKQTTPAATTPDATKEEAVVEETPKKTNWWDTASTAFNAILPSIRPSDAEALDAAQLYPEMFAMATNQLTPVQAQTYQPELSVPYDISFQDQLNANQADYRAAQRMMGYNPAAQANLNAQKYQANQSTLANQFRANQEMKNKVYDQNRNILNDAKLKNLDIFDRQYERQTEALANTKATTQAALNSIADKYAKNKLENRELKTYENMYNYRFGPNFRAQNMNPLAQWDTDYKGMSSEELDAMSVLKKAQEKREAAAAKKDKAVSRNGSIVKHYKNI